VDQYQWGICACAVTYSLRVPINELLKDVARTQSQIMGWIHGIRNIP
jgi:hypothetical protein